jgi:hypothetical protein
MGQNDHTAKAPKRKVHLRLAADSAGSGGVPPSERSTRSITGAPTLAVSGTLRRIRTVDPATGRTALITRSLVPPGSILSVTVIDPQGSGEDRTFKLSCLDWQALERTQEKVRRYLVAGRLPAAAL